MLGVGSGKVLAMDTYLNTRIETITEEDFWVVFNPAEVPVTVGRRRVSAWAAAITDPRRKGTKLTTDGTDLTDRNG